jgi:hypothetical protein
MSERTVTNIRNQEFEFAKNSTALVCNEQQKSPMAGTIELCRSRGIKCPGLTFYHRQDAGATTLWGFFSPRPASLR